MDGRVGSGWMGGRVGSGWVGGRVGGGWCKVSRAELLKIGMLRKINPYKLSEKTHKMSNERSNDQEQESSKEVTKRSRATNFLKA